jgi:hypothetical protein
MEPIHSIRQDILAAIAQVESAEALAKTLTVDNDELERELGDKMDFAGRRLVSLSLTIAKLNNPDTDHFVDRFATDGYICGAYRGAFAVTSSFKDVFVPGSDCLATLADAHAALVGALSVFE